jgi:hypothetical protein
MTSDPTPALSFRTRPRPLPDRTLTSYAPPAPWGSYTCGVATRHGEPCAIVVAYPDQRCRWHDHG